MKQAILDLLRELRGLGKDRRTVEKDLHYSPNYIDQALSKGGNERFYLALKRYREALAEEGPYRYSEGGARTAGSGTAMAVSEPTETYGGGFWKQIPEYRSCNYATQARGHAMEPLIRQNAIVGGRRLDDPGFIVYGEIYIIQARNGMEVIRYIRAATDAAVVLLAGADESVPATEMRRADIERVYHAQFVVNPL
jgi:hypothetical protein